MATKDLKNEYAFEGTTLNGFLMLFVNLFLTFGSIGIGIWAGIEEVYAVLVMAIVLFIVSLFIWGGFLELEPNEARVLLFFGKYKGTFTRTGFYWVNPFLTSKKLSLRARNLDAEPIKVNDKTGNPVMIGLMLVWKLKDTYKAMFEIDSQTIAGDPAKNGQVVAGSNVAGVMQAFENFVKIQSDAALREVAGKYAYDDDDDDKNAITLRDGGTEINQQLEQKLDERLSMAGIEVVEARINYLAYAPEIAAVMLRRQQASAIISAREKIVEGAVSMVKMALDKLAADSVVTLDDEKKAAMVSNLMVVLCGDDSAQPVVNAGI
ncbi:MAG: SPFH domain-containing protein [Prevotella sp.]